MLDGKRKAQRDFQSQIVGSSQWNLLFQIRNDGSSILLKIEKLEESSEGKLKEKKKRILKTIKQLKLNKKHEMWNITI